jgi:hypothetical protein
VPIITTRLALRTFTRLSSLLATPVNFPDSSCGNVSDFFTHERPVRGNRGGKYPKEKAWLVARILRILDSFFLKRPRCHVQFARIANTKQEERQP